MKPSLLFRLMTLLSGLTLLASLQACGDASSKSLAAAPPPPRTSAVYTLMPRQSVALGPNASVTLDHVNDSRCQPGKVCVWAGYLSYSLTLHGPAGETSFVLADAMPGVARSTTLQGLTFALENNDGEMATAAGATAPDYRVSLRVTLSATQLATRPRAPHATN
jgi:hypothetical protein